MSHCNIQGGWAGIGNIDADPLFFDAPGGDFHLKQDPCQPGVINPSVDAGNHTAFNVALQDGSTRTDGVADSSQADLGAHYGPPAILNFETDADELQESAGGTIQFALRPGLVHLNRNYLILGSASGTEPGIPLPGGTTILPLNRDWFTPIVMSLVNTTICVDFMGVINETGTKTAQLVTGPLPPGSAGLKIYFAYAMNNPFNFASNPLEIEIVP